MAPYGQCARPRLQNSAGTIGALKLHIMSHRGHCEARRPGSKGHFLHRGGGATGSATCPFAQLGKVYKRVAGMLCGELVIPQCRSSVFDTGAGLNYGTFSSESSNFLLKLGDNI